MQITIKNLCPHDVNVKDANGKIWTIKPESIPARVDTDFSPVFYIGAIGVFRRSLNGTTNLPPVTDGTMYIVSRQVANYDSDRKDLLVPTKTWEENGISYCCGLEIL